MNSVKLLGAAFAALAVSACNPGQPRIWRVAFDASAIESLSVPTCYIGQRIPTFRTQQQNYRRDADWIIWDGVDGKQFLDLGNPTFKLGDSPVLNVEDVVEGDGSTRTFTAQRIRIQAGPTQRAKIAQETRTSTVVVTWDDYNPAARGTVRLRSEYACQDVGVNLDQQCPRPERMEQPAVDGVSCEVTLPFVARRIDVNQNTNYGNTGRTSGVCTPPNTGCGAP